MVRLQPTQQQAHRSVLEIDEVTEVPITTLLLPVTIP